MVPSLAKVIDRFRALWEEGFAPHVRIAREGTEPAHYRANGERCLANYYRRHYPFDQGETLGVEERLSFRLDATDRYRLQGVVDRIVRAPDDALEIHDYKTGQRVPRQEQLDQDRQLALYQIGVAERFGADRPIRLVWHYLLSDQLRSSSRTPEHLVSLRRGTIELIDRIRAEQRFEPRPSALCRWCEYREICPAGAARGAPPSSAESAPRGSAPPERAPVPATAAGQLLLRL
jgi:putative RecB family exonuclease